MNMDTGFLIGVILGQLLAGALFGLVPFFVGRKREVRGWGIAGLICCMIGSLIWLTSPFPIAAVFTIIILLKSR